MVLPLLLGLLGSGLASTGAMAGLGALASPLVAGSIGAGLGGYAETGDLETGILTGLGSFAGGSLLGPVLGGMGKGAATAAGANAASSGATNAATTAATTAATGGGGTVTSLMPQLAQKATQAGISNAAMNAPLSQRAIDTLTASTAASAGPQSGIGSLFGKGTLGDTARGGMAWGKTPTGMGQIVGSSIAPLAGGMFAGGGGGGGKKKMADHKERQPLPRSYTPPPAGYRAGFDPEWNYGISTPQSAEDIRRYTTQHFAAGGIVNGMQPIHLSGGGIADLAPPAPPSNEKQIITDAIAAIKGELPDPRPALGVFLKTYGEEALRDLAQKVEDGEIGGPAAENGEGMVRGAGDGMDDRVPASVAGSNDDVLLADSEYVVPADVVSHLGNGSSDAGAKVLDGMLERVRQARTGKAQQAPQIDPNEVVPA